MNWGFRLITTQPIERADSIAKFKFSILWYIVAGVMFIASGEIGGTLPGTALLINLLSQRKYLPENDSVLDCFKNVL